MKFEDYISLKEDVAPLGNAAQPQQQMPQQQMPQQQMPQQQMPQQNQRQQAFQNTGIDKGDISRVVRSLQQLLQGVGASPNDRQARRIVNQKLRPKIRELMAMGMTVDDLPIVFQDIMNMVISGGSATQTKPSIGKVKNAFNNQVNNAAMSDRTQ